MQMRTLRVADFTECDPISTGVWKTTCKHNLKSPLCNPRFIVNDEMITAHEGQVLQMTVKDILECVNDGRNPEWIDYDETDFIEGMYEWTYLFLTDKTVYDLLGIRSPDAPKRLIDIYG